MTALLLVAFCALARPAAADPVQVSDTFRRVAKAVARDTAKKTLEKACDGARKHKDVCAALTAELVSLVVDVIDGASPAPATLQRFRKTLQRTFAAVAIVEVHDWGEQHLAAMLGDDLSKQALPALDCVAEYVLTGDKAKCADLIAVGASFAACTARADVGDQAVCVLGEIANLPGVSNNQTLANAVLQLQIGVRILDEIRQSLVTDSDLFGAVQRMFREIEELDYRLAVSIDSHGVFDAPTITAAAAGCPQQATELGAFLSNRVKAYEAYASAIVSGGGFDQIPPGLRIPALSTEPCADKSEIAALEKWMLFAQGFLAHGSLSSALHQVEIPALVLAALVDVIRDGDADIGSKALALATHTLRRRFGSASPSNACVPRSAAAPHVFDCVRADGVTFTVTRQASVSDPLLEQLLQGRRGAGAARTNCLVQLVTAVVSSEPLARDLGGGARCWMDRWSADAVWLARMMGPSLTVSTDIVVTAAAAVEDAPVVYQWGAGSVVAETADTFRLAIAHRTVPERFFDFVADKLAADAGIDRGVLDAIKRILRSGNADPKTLATGLALVIGKVIEEPVKRMLDGLYPADCSKSASKASCAIRALATVFMETAVYASIRTDQEDAVIDELVRKAGEIKETVLDESPFLFELGLGFNNVGVWSGSDDRWAGTSSHFTLVDKWGAVTRKGDGYLGVFVGGFVDAIIRDEDRRLLVGVTAGKRRLWSGLPLGLSAHAAYAAPVDPDSSFKAFSVGVSLTIPTSYLYDE